jgi:hypothetical protein
MASRQLVDDFQKRWERLVPGSTITAEEVIKLLLKVTPNLLSQAMTRTAMNIRSNHVTGKPVDNEIFMLRSAVLRELDYHKERMGQ